MKEIEAEGKTVTLAVEKGLSELGLRRDQVEVQIIEEAAPGFLGLGAKPARVRLREKIWGVSEGSGPAAPAAEKKGRSPHHPSQRPAPSRERAAPQEQAAGRAPSGYRTSRPPVPTARRPVIHEAPPDTALACSETKLVIEEILKLLEVPGVSIQTSWDADQARVRAEVETPEGQSLLDRGEKFLESLQFLVTLIASRRVKHPVAVQVETGGYWRDKEEEILLQVHQAMEMVKRTSRPVRLKPMSAVMRRLVHRTLARHPEFETVSEGDGIWRKVVLKPRKK